MIVPFVLAVAGAARLASAANALQPVELGCYSALPSDAYAAVIVNTETPNPYVCADNCRAGANGAQIYSLYQASTTNCFCSPSGPAASAFAASASTNSAVVCSNSANYGTLRTMSSYRHLGCFATSSCTNTDTTVCAAQTASGLNTIFNSAGSSTDIFITPGSSAFTLNRDSTGVPPQVACAPGTGIYLQRDATSAASNAVQRRRARDARAAQIQLDASLEFCPQGMTPCKEGSGSYECLNTATEVESCGGCTLGIFGQDNAKHTAGVDCLAREGVVGSSCVRGQCVDLSCKTGFTLVNGVCA